MDKLIREIYNLQQQRDRFNVNAQKLKDQISNVDELIDAKKAELMQMVKDAGVNEVNHDELVCIRVEKPSVGYTSEADVMSMLKEKYSGKYINVKVTESIDKRGLKKALKEDINLHNDLSSFIEDKTTEYLVITTAENRARMLEYMEKN